MTDIADMADLVHADNYVTDGMELSDSNVDELIFFTNDLENTFTPLCVF